MSHINTIVGDEKALKILAKVTQLFIIMMSSYLY
jgi:hypothetical protein